MFLPYFENPQKNNTTLHEIPTGDNLGNPIQRVRALCFVRATRVTNDCVFNASFENSADIEDRDRKGEPAVKHGC